MELFTYLMAKNDHNTSVKKDLFSYLLGKNQSGTYQEYTGTSLSISNTKKGKMKIDLYGNTSQESLSGKNLANVNVITSSSFTISPDGEEIKLAIATSGNGATSSGKTLQELCPTLTVGDTVYLYFTRNLGTQHNNIIYLISSATEWGNGTSKIITQQMLDSIVYFYANRYQDGETSQCILTDFRIVKTQNDTWEPYCGGTPSPNPDYPQQIHTVTKNNTIKVCGKNLANINVIDSLDVPAFKRIVANDTITIWDNTNTSGFMTTERKLSQICPSLKVGDTVTLTYTTTWSSNYIYLVGWNNVWINGSTKTITQEMLDSTVIMYGGYNATTVISNFMFRYSTADSTYEPYQSTSYPLTLGSIELNKIGTYQDYFYKDSGNWYLHKEIGKVVLDGDNTSLTSGGTNTSGYNRWRVTLDNPKPTSSTSEIAQIFSDKLIGVSAGNTWNRIQGISIDTSNNYSFFYIEDVATYTLNNFKTWLTSNPITLYYILATPTYTQITGTLKDELEDVWRANSYKGTTNINQTNNDLPFNLDVEIKVGS